MQKVPAEKFWKGLRSKALQTQCDALGEEILNDQTFEPGFHLGDKVKCIYTGYEGIVTGIGTFLGRPDRVVLVSSLNAGKIHDEWIAISRLSLALPPKGPSLEKKTTKKKKPAAKKKAAPKKSGASEAPLGSSASTPPNDFILAVKKAVAKKKVVKKAAAKKKVVL